MRFQEAGTFDTFRQLDGEARNDRDPARRFCEAYRSVGRLVFGRDTLHLEPVFRDLADGRGDSKVRVSLTQEEAPGLFRRVYECTGKELGDMDVIVLMFELMLSDPRIGEHRWRMLAVLLMDAASTLADSAPVEPAIGWAGRVVLRAAICAVLTRATESMLPAGEVDAAYSEICACAVTTLVDDRYDRMNGAVIFVAENPGIATLLRDVVSAARRDVPLALPMDADDALLAGVALVAAAIDAFPSRAKAAA